MAAIDKVKQARGLASPAPDTPPPRPSQPPASQAEFRELLALLRSLEGQMTAWPQAIGEETSRVLRAAQQQNEEFQKTEAAAWHQERREWIRQTNEALRHGQAIAKSHEAQNTRQQRLIERQEKRGDILLLGLTRGEWWAIFMGIMLGAILVGAVRGWQMFIQ